MKHKKIVTRIESNGIHAIVHGDKKPNRLDIEAMKGIVNAAVEHLKLSESIRVVALFFDGSERAYYRSNHTKVEKLLTELARDPLVSRAEIMEAPNWISGTPTHVQCDIAPATSTKH